MKRGDFLKTMGLGTLAPAAMSGGLISGANKKVLRIAHLTDVHIQPGLGAPEGLAQCLHHMQSLDEPVDMIFNGGDSIYDALETDRQKVARQWKTWHKVMQTENDLPVVDCIGNHDVWGAGPKNDPNYGKKWAMDEFGLDQRYYSFDRAGWHFIVLDSTHPVKDGWYTARLDDEQYDWLKRELDDTPAETPIFVLSHIPILTITSFMIDDTVKKGNFEIPGSWSHTDAQKIVKLFSQYDNVKLCASGHMHMVDHVDYHGTSYVCNGAVCGGWWRGPYYQNYAGYAVINLYEDGSWHNENINYGWEPRKTR